MPRITKTELLAKITKLEEELGLSNAECERLQRELDAQYVAQRPSRREGDRACTDFKPTVRVPRALPEYMQRARELAMRTGRTVKVGV